MASLLISFSYKKLLIVVNGNYSQCLRCFHCNSVWHYVIKRRSRRNRVFINLIADKQAQKPENKEFSNFGFPVCVLQISFCECVTDGPNNKNILNDVIIKNPYYMESWKATIYEHFAGNRQVMPRFYRVDKFFITYKRFDIWYEMLFEHNLN